MRSRHEGTKARRHEGFTLVEMTIVIGIIVLLAGLTLTVGVAVVQGSEVRQTELTIRLLDAAVQEWEAQADRKVTYGIDGQPQVVPTDPYPVYEIRQPTILTEDETNAVTAKLMAILLRSAGSREILARINPDLSKPATIDHDDLPGTAEVDTMIVNDAWGNPLSVVLPGRLWVNTDFTTYGYLANADGTIQTETEKVCGAATNRQVCFVSKGPDEMIGDLHPSAAVEDREMAQDNLYSYVPATPQ